MANNDKDNKIKKEAEKKVNENTDEKVELAQFIADKSQKLSKRTESLANGAFRILHWLSDWFDRILFNPKHAKLVAFGVALLLYFSFSSPETVKPMNSSTDFTNVAVNVTYNPEMYEIAGVDKNVKVTFIGSQSDISLLNLDSSSIKAELDLSGLTDGKHQVKYKVDGVSSRIRTIIEPASANVTIRTKDAQKVALDYDFINMDKLDPKYVLSEPELEVREVSIKASSETLDKVAFVKALVDVSGQTNDFEVDATIVAYNQNGEKLDQVDIIPNTVKAKVGVSSPHKTVPIKLVFDGDFPEGKAISSHTLDADTIMIYAPQTVLDQIEEIRVPVSTALLTSDTTKLQQNINLPTGVRHGNVSKVNIEIKLGEATSQVIENVVVTYRNNIEGFKASLHEKEDSNMTITVYGTKENLEAFSADNPNGFNKDKLVVYIDLRNAKVGENQEFPLFVEYVDVNSPRFRLQPSKTKIVLDIMK